MADASKTAQLAPAATTLSTLYTCPSSTTAAVRVTVCNRSTATSFRLSLAPLGAADATSQYLYYDLALAANDTFVTPILTLTATDLIRCYSTSGNVTFTANGIEVT